MPHTLESPSITTEFPLLRTNEGRLLDVSSLDHDYLQDGFIIEEQDPLTVIVEDLHKLHSRIAAAIVGRVGLLPTVRLVKEFDSKAFGNQTAPHLDGFDYRFWQVNTPHAPGQDESFSPFTRLLIRRFNIDDAEHEALHNRYQRLQNTSPYESIWFHPVDFDLFDDGITEQALNRPPDDMFSGVAGPSRTLVFPNGYDASESSGPGVLYVHSAHTAQDMSGAPSSATRLLTMSRIEPTSVPLITQ